MNDHSTDPRESLIEECKDNNLSGDRQKKIGMPAIKPLTGYELSRQWFAMVWENPDITANDTALYMLLCDIWNRIGHPASFNITSKECMQGMSARNYKTYKKSFDRLRDMGCFELVKKSANQYQCNIIALVVFDKAPAKAFTKALLNANTEAPAKAKDTFIKQQTTKLKPQKGKDSEVGFSVSMSGFDKFYEAYPKKKSKGDAEAAWNKIKPSAALVEKMIENVEAQKKSEQWKEDNGKYIPHPATYLNKKGWEDEIVINDPSEKKFLVTGKNHTGNFALKMTQDKIDELKINPIYQIDLIKPL